MSRLCLLVLHAHNRSFPVQPQPPANQTVVLENDYVRISKALFASSTKSSLHFVPPRLSAVVVHFRFFIGVRRTAPLNINEFEYVSIDFFIRWRNAPRGEDNSVAAACSKSGSN